MGAVVDQGHLVINQRDPVVDQRHLGLSRRRQQPTDAQWCKSGQSSARICERAHCCLLWGNALLQRWRNVDLLCWQVAFLQCWRGSSTQRWHAVDHAVLSVDQANCRVARSPGEQVLAAAACGGTAGLNGSTCRSTAADSRIEQQVEAGEVVGGATVVAGGSCRCLAGFRHRLTLPPTVARAAVREREEEGRLLARTNLSRHPLTPPSSPPFLPTQQQGDGGEGGAWGAGAADPLPPTAAPAAGGWRRAAGESYGRVW
ncbi:unnamed protein product [Closterium sp. NIES-53]